MTTFHLVRHAAHVLQDRVMVGRTPGIALSETGWAQVRALADRFTHTALDGVVSSPRRRARETAAAIAAATAGAPLEIAEGLDELHFGEWTGRTPDDLSRDPRWHAWNTQRASHRCPGGESMDELWARTSPVLAALHRRAPLGKFALVTHAEPIRAALLKAMQRSFDDFHAIPCKPASVTTLVFHRGLLMLVADDEKAAA